MHRLPSFVYEVDRQFTFSDCEHLIECAEHRARPNYVVKPILRRIPSLAIKPSSPKEEPPKLTLTLKKLPKIRIIKDRQLPLRFRPCGCVVGANKVSTLPKIFRVLSARKQRRDRRNKSLELKEKNASFMDKRLTRDASLPSSFKPKSPTRSASCPKFTSVRLKSQSK